ncbi:hypothetical protein Tsubulata_015222 [Turnera subulata]|uniref:Light-harvesting complex-like protein OHP2, chloroplastic n=1 Tax=Turnera subulata TaxID=218843 RepID=A0A9Q0FJF0_9ROSI|nr:hypothetical protein Tsubulata_015222 [Turnera subulata]
MSVASSVPCIKIPNPSPSCSHPSPSSSAASASSSYFVRFSRARTSAVKSASSASSSSSYVLTVRNSQAEGPLRRPVAPPLKKPTPPSPSPSLSPPPSPPSTPPPVAPPPKPAAQVGMQDKNVVTLEFQRQKARELLDYFKQKKLEEADQGPFFGFIGKNEIANGRWAMFGFAVGMLTEYATGSDFVDQVKILLSNFGIIDLD